MIWYDCNNEVIINYFIVMHLYAIYIQVKFLLTPIAVHRFQEQLSTYKIS